jgi:hypothetical protein
MLTLDKRCLEHDVTILRNRVTGTALESRGLVVLSMQPLKNNNQSV